MSTWHSMCLHSDKVMDTIAFLMCEECDIQVEVLNEECHIQVEVLNEIHVISKTHPSARLKEECNKILSDKKNLISGVKSTFTSMY